MSKHGKDKGRNDKDSGEGLPYRRGVGVLVVNRDGGVFVGRRIDTPGDAWQMPQGGIDEGETPRDAALRELREETGIDRVRLIAETDDWLRYDLPDELIGVAWKGRYRGQEQRWFAALFLGTDEEIDLEAHDAEFDDWRWVGIDALPSLIVPFKRDLYARIVADLAPKVRATLT